MPPLSRRSGAPRLRVEELEDRAVPANITVTTLADTLGGPNVSLRDAIILANSTAEDDTIFLPAGTLQLSLTGAGEDAAQTGDLDVTSLPNAVYTTTVAGSSFGQTVIDGAGIDRVFDVQPGARLIVNGPVIRGGSADIGGGIRNRGILVLVGSTTAIEDNFASVRGGGVAHEEGSFSASSTTFRNNRAGDVNDPTSTAIGGGVAAGDAANFIDATFIGNTAGGGGDGGALAYRGSGSVSQSLFTGNRAGNGGAVSTIGGNVFLERSTFDGNFAVRSPVTGSGAGGLGGAVFGRGSVWIDTSTFTRNEASGVNGRGGALANADFMSVENSTITGNFAGSTSGTLSTGAGVYTTGAVELYHVTISDNVARLGGFGAGVHVNGGSAAIRNTIVARNGMAGSNAPDAAGVFTSEGGNLIGISVGSSGWVATDQLGSFIAPIDPLLGSLQNNGGRTQTRALLSGSPALDRGVPNPSNLQGDQREFFRPSGPAPDVGAFEVQVVPNRPPVAAADSYVTNEDTPLNTPAQGVLMNDTDLDGDPLTAAVATGPTHGALTLNADGSFVYTPAADYNGPDGFTYTVSDGNGGTATGTVSITVAAVNDAPGVTAPPTLTTNEDTPLFVTGVSVSDADAGSAAVAVTLSVAHGQLSVATAVAGGVTTAQVIGNGTATVTLTAPIAAINTTLGSATGLRYLSTFNYNGSDTLTVSANDQGNTGGGGAKTGTGAVAITVNPVNDTPRGNPVHHTIDEDTPVSGTATATDFDGDPLTYSGDVPPEYQPAHGAVIVSADGAYTYTPAADFNGTDTFLIKVTDPAGAVGAVQVTVQVMPVNDAPVAGDDTYTVDEDQPLTVAVGPATRLRMVSEPGDFIGQGGAGGTQPLVLDYAPSGSGFSAGTNFDNGVQVRVADATVVGGWTLNFAAAGNQLLTPGTYPGAMRFPFQDATHPGLDVSGNGRGHNMLTGRFVVYDVAYGASGAVTRFAATFVQQGLDFDGTVDPPLWGTILFNTTFGGRGGVLANDTDVEDILLTASVVTGPSHGTLALNSDGTFTYTPNANFHGVDTFTYQTNDGRADSNVATVTINVKPVNDAPTADAKSATTDEDTVVLVTPTGVDVDGDALTFAVVDAPQHGTVSVDAAGDFVYTPDADYNGPDSFTYTASDGNGGSATATVTVTVKPVNDAPTAAAQSFTTDEDVTLRGRLAAADVDGDALAFSPVSGPSHGVLTLNGDGTFTYTPAANYNGPDAFTFRVTDGTASATATVALGVRSVNDVPTLSASPTAVSLAENSATGTAIPVAFDAADVDGDALAYALVGGTGAFAIDPTTGRITVADSRQLDYETTPRFTLLVEVSDGHGGRAQTTVTVDLTDVVETRRPAIDVRPGARANEINTKSNGKIEVAILGAVDFDVRSIDVGSLRFGKSGREGSLSMHPNQGPRYRFADVNGDGRLDLVVEVEVEKTGFEGGEATAYLTGRMTDGTAFEASDSVSVKNPGRGR